MSDRYILSSKETVIAEQRCQGAMPARDNLGSKEAVAAEDICQGGDVLARYI